MAVDYLEFSRELEAKDAVIEKLQKRLLEQESLLLEYEEMTLEINRLSGSIDHETLLEMEDKFLVLKSQHLNAELNVLEKHDVKTVVRDDVKDVIESDAKTVVETDYKTVVESDTETFVKSEVESRHDYCKEAQSKHVYSPKVQLNLVFTDGTQLIHMLTNSVLSCQMLMNKSDILIIDLNKLTPILELLNSESLSGNQSIQISYVDMVYPNKAMIKRGGCTQSWLYHEAVSEGGG